MSSHLAASTRMMSNLKIGSADTVSIMPPTRLGRTVAVIAALVAGSAPTSTARARIASSSSSGPGRAWIAQRGSRRRSSPLGEERGIAAYSLPAARTGQNGCSRGLPSGRTVARLGRSRTARCAAAAGCHAVPAGGYLGGDRALSRAVHPGDQDAVRAAPRNQPSLGRALSILTQHYRENSPAASDD